MNILHMIKVLDSLNKNNGNIWNKGRRERNSQEDTVFGNGKMAETQKSGGGAGR